jgi:hypothetical protein
LGALIASCPDVPERVFGNQGKCDQDIVERRRPTHRPIIHDRAHVVAKLLAEMNRGFQIAESLPHGG